jgi:NADPH:quinone reductase-like Zn-dependent oxidoreductase
VRQIRTLRARWRELETGLRTLLGGHEGGNPGYRQGGSSEPPRQFSTLPNAKNGLVADNTRADSPCSIAADGRRLADIGKIIDDGKLHPLVQAVLPLDQVKEALELSRSRHVAGKIVLAI